MIAAPWVRQTLQRSLRSGFYASRMSFHRRSAGVICVLVMGAGTVALRVQAVAATRPETLTLDQAIKRAMANQPAFASAKAEQQALALERTNARMALLPTATYHNEAVYTKPNGVPTSRIGQTTNAPAPAFIANNAVREYVSQGVFDEKVGLAQIAAIRLADATAAKAAAELEVARRGLVSTVTTLYYGIGAGTSKLKVAREALAEADHFVDITQRREAEREAAHADVLKAQLTQQQRQRDLLDAQAAAEKARLELGVLLYPDPATTFELAAPSTPAPLPDIADVEALAQKNNPELRSALASVQASHAETLTAQAALLPQLGLNFTYGIDATNVGVNGPDGIRNLGYSMSARLDIPVWDWLSTERTVKANQVRETAAKVALTATQRRAAADLRENYTEAKAAYQQLASLDASVVTARESLRLTELRYVNGESTVLEVVDAQNTLTSAENARIDGLTRYEAALSNLQMLTGTF